MPLLGALAAVGLLLLLAGAVVAHLRNGDSPRSTRPRSSAACSSPSTSSPARSPHEHRAVPVVIIGAGPTGLTAATLLAQYGVECLVLDRWEASTRSPARSHLDDEVYRILARLGVRDEFAAISRPCHGLRLVDRNMRVLAEFRRDTAEGHHGYPQANMFDQPELEDLLRDNLAQYPTVTLRGNAEVTA